MIEDIDALRTHFRANIQTIGMKPDQVIMANGGSKNVDEKQPWALFQITPGAAEEQGFDTHVRILQTGFIMLQVYVPKGEGSKIGYQIAEDFRKMWFKWRQRSDTGYVLTKVGYPRQVSNDDFFQINVFIPYDSVRMMPL